MTPKKVFLSMLGLVLLSSLSIIAVSYLGVNELKKQSRQLVDLKATNLALENQQIELAKANQNIKKYENLEELTQAIIPQDKDQAKAVREIIVLASESNIAIKSVTFPASNLGAKVPSQKSESTEVPTKPAENPISQAKPVPGIKSLYSLEATFMPERDVSYYNFIEFLSKLEKNRRTSQVNRIKIEPKSSTNNDPKISFILTINIFLKP